MAPAQSREPRIVDRYALHGVIASGGMAAVHFGRLLGAQGFARTVAIKRLHPQFAADPAFSSMLLDEARLAVRIRHPNVVTTLDSVQVDGELFLVMEYIAGESLSGLIREAARRGLRLPLDVGSAIVAGMLAGLHAAHEATGEDGEALEIVHRDISPQNILVGQDGVARVLDFGIARAAVRSQASRTGQVKGKLSYMAPEQLRGGPMTRRTDIFAASVVLWEVITGQRLYAGESDAEIYGRILEGVIQPPSAVVNVPPQIDRMVLRGLAASPELRYQTALEMAIALEALLPPASARQVGAWVEATAGELLAARASSVIAIESQRSPRSVQTHSPPSSGIPVEAVIAQRGPETDRSPVRDVKSRPVRPEINFPTLPTLTKTIREMEGPRSRTPETQAFDTPVLDTPLPEMRVREMSIGAATPPRRNGAWLGGGLALVAGALLIAALGLERWSASARPERALKGAASIKATATLAGVLVARAEARAPASAAPPQAASAAAQPAAAASRTPALASGARSLMGAPRAVPPRPRCEPPYTVDAKGIRRIKRECR